MYLDDAELRKRGKRIRIGPQAFKALAFLATHADRLVTREELCREIWGENTFVDFEQGLNFCLWTIRAALADHPKRPRYIETVVKRGYRFLVPPRPICDTPCPIGPAATPARECRAPSVSSARRWRLTISSIRNLTDERAGETLSLGLRELLLTELVASDAFVVMRPSRELGADVVLEGALVRSADRIQLAARLVDVHSGTYLWAGRRDCGAMDRPPHVEGVVSDLVGELGQKLPAIAAAQRRLAIQSEALEVYWQGRMLFDRRTPEDLHGAIRRFEFAVRKDPEFAQAFSGQAMAAAVLAGLSSGRRSHLVQNAVQAASKALELDSAQAEALAALGSVERLLRVEWDGAQRAFEQAIELDASRATPHQWLAFVLAVRGQLAQALQEIRMARWLAPDSPMIAANEVLLLHLAGRDDEAMEICRGAVARNPSFAMLRLELGLLLEKRLQARESLEEMQMAARLSNDHPYMLAGLCRAHVAAGSRSRARQVLRRLRMGARGESASAYGVAAGCAALGDKEEALDWLGKACERREPTLVMLPVDPLWDRLRDDRGFAALERQYGFPAIRPSPPGSVPPLVF